MKNPLFQTVLLLLAALPPAGCRTPNARSAGTVPLESRFQRLLPGSSTTRPHPGMLVVRWHPTVDGRFEILAVDLKREDIELRPALTHNFPDGDESSWETLSTLRVRSGAWAAISGGVGTRADRTPGPVVVDGQWISRSTAPFWGLAVRAGARAALITQPRPGDVHFIPAGPALLLAGTVVDDLGPGGSVNRAPPPLPAGLLDIPQNRTAICTTETPGTVYFAHFETGASTGGETLGRFARRLRALGCRDAILSATGEHAGLDLGQEPFTGENSRPIDFAWIVVPDRNANAEAEKQNNSKEDSHER